MNRGNCGYSSPRRGEENLRPPRMKRSSRDHREQLGKPLRTHILFYDHNEQRELTFTNPTKRTVNVKGKRVYTSIR